MTNKNILILSGRYPATTFHSPENHRAYANKFGYSYIHRSWPGKSKNPYFNKIEYILEYIDFYDYIFWIDDDAFFLDFENDISNYIPQKGNILTICSSPKYKKIWTYINSGQFMIQASNTSKELLQDVLNVDMDKVKKWWDEDVYGFYSNGDQDAIVYFLMTKYGDLADIRDAYEFNSRIDEIGKNNINILHFTGTSKVKNKSLKSAMKSLNLDYTLINKKYTYLINYRDMRLRKKFIEEYVRYLISIH